MSRNRRKILKRIGAASMAVLAAGTASASETYSGTSDLRLTFPDEEGYTTLDDDCICENGCDSCDCPSSCPACAC